VASTGRGTSTGRVILSAREESSLILLGCDEFRGGPDCGGEAFAVFCQRTEVAFHLETIPEALGLPEESPEANRHGRSDRASSEDYLVDRTGRNPDRTGHRILGNPHGLEIFLQQDFAGCDW